MKRAALKIAESLTIDRDDYAAMAEALNRLHRAATHTIGDIVGSLSPSERAKLAVFCYGRAHLNAVGLAIAAQCDLEHLMAASGSAAAGRVLYAQSREAAPARRPVSGRRAITLASSVSGRFASLAAQAAQEQCA